MCLNTECMLAVRCVSLGAAVDFAFDSRARGGTSVPRCAQIEQEQSSGLKVVLLNFVICTFNTVPHILS
jgi:hypothetical protein